MKRLQKYIERIEYYNEGDIQIQNVFLSMFQTLPNEYKYVINFNKKEFIETVIATYSLQKEDIIYNERNEPDEETKLTLNFIMFIKRGFIAETCNSGLYLYYDASITLDERQAIIDIATKYKEIKDQKKFFHMVCKSYNDLDLRDFEIKSHEIDLTRHYNDDFGSIDSIIKSSLNDKSKNGIILLHGLFGTGKTYYIRHLINSIDRKFIYFPLYMIDSISSPEFLPFLSEHPHSVLILEDCENLLVHRENGAGNNNALSNLLNLGDGLLSDALSINVICTFNSNVKKIDDALLRKGRMLARYEFKELTTDKTMSLAQSLGKQLNEPKQMTLADIYNIEDRSFQNEKHTKIGFN
jgi:hypothetical protein